MLSAETLQAAVEKAGFVLQDVLNALPEDARLGDWEQAVHQIDGRMRRLEPVNLAAIHEYGEASQRSDYLDSQHADLTTALEPWKMPSARSTARPAAASRTLSTVSTPACRRCTRACSVAATPTWN